MTSRPDQTRRTQSPQSKREHRRSKEQGAGGSNAAVALGAFYPAAGLKMPQNFKFACVKVHEQRLRVAILCQDDR